MLSDHPDLNSLLQWCQFTTHVLYSVALSFQPNRDTANHLAELIRESEAIGEAPFETVVDAREDRNLPRYQFAGSYYPSAPHAVREMLGIMHAFCLLPSPAGYPFANLLGYAQTAEASSAFDRQRAAESLLRTDCLCQIRRAARLREQGDTPIVVEAEPPPQTETARGDASARLLPDRISQGTIDRLLEVMTETPRPRIEVVRAARYRSESNALAHLRYMVEQGIILTDEANEVFLPPSLPDRNNQTS